jgi:hypothetical protein
LAVGPTSAAGDPPAALARLIKGVGAEGKPAKPVAAEGVRNRRPADDLSLAVVFVSPRHRVSFPLRASLTRSGHALATKPRR